MTTLQEPILGKKPELVQISNSELNTFKGCRRQWWLTYYRGLKSLQSEMVGPLPLGTRLHNALECYYKFNEHPMDAYNRLQRLDANIFLESEEAQWEDNVTKFNKESELGRIMMEGYIEWMAEENPDAGLEIANDGAERVLAYRPKLFPRVELRGKVDLQVRRPLDKSRACMDHKSAISFDPYYLHAHMSEQLMMYTMLASKDPDDDTPLDGGIYNLMRKVKRTATAKPPFYARIDVRFNKKTLESFEIRTLGTVSDMMNVRDALDEGADHRYVAYPKPVMDWHCSKCPFFKVCPLLDDGSSAEQMIEDYFHQVDPNARYDVADSETI